MIHDDSHWEIPSSIDLEGFLKKHKPDFKYKIDHFYYIVEYLGKGMEQEDLDKNEGFINTNSVKLQSRIKNYKQYLKHMLDHSFIRTDMKYILGKKSKGYLLSGLNSNNVTLQKIPITDFVARKNRKKENNETLAKIKKTQKKYSYLTKWFNHNLKIDSEKAAKKINELFPVQTGPIKGKLKGRPSDYNRRVKAIYSLSRFEAQSFYYNVDDNIGRFHSNLTNIKKELRNYITYDGKKLVNVDIKNSQPFFSTLLFNPAFYEEKSEIISIYSIPTAIPLLSSISSSSSLSSSSFPSTVIMLGKTMQDTDKEEYREYIDMVNSGDFYKKLHGKIYPELPYYKGKLKEIVYVVFFSSNRFIGQVKAQKKRDFKSSFPEVYKLFALIKKKDHRALSHLLQRIESEIIIERVTKRISLEKPELPIFTIHDSVATTQGDEKYVSSVITEEVKQATGLDVKLGLEYWNP